MKLVTIDLLLDVEENQRFSYQKASLMQGVLMEWLDSDYAEKLHSGGWNPYAQYLEKVDGAWHWIVKMFDEEACQNISKALLDETKKSVYLRHEGTEIHILNRKIDIIETEDLLNQYYFQDAPKQIRIRFKTPTAFKRQGDYLFYPDIRCILQSMILKYDAVTAKTGNVDEKILEELVKNTKILQYHIRSSYFSLERVKIPAFTGEIFLGLRGSQTMINYIHFLFHFACYSGIGIKASMGMGAIEIKEKRK